MNNLENVPTVDLQKLVDELQIKLDVITEKIEFHQEILSTLVDDDINIQELEELYELIDECQDSLNELSNHHLEITKELLDRE